MSGFNHDEIFTTVVLALGAPPPVGRGTYNSHIEYARQARELLLSNVKAGEFNYGMFRLWFVEQRREADGQHE